MNQIITIHPAAPTKPAFGGLCNGCGVCCAAEPCPIGVLVSGRRHGRCRALVWDEAMLRHWCGMVSQPENFVGRLPRWATSGLSALSARMISAGRGCDSDAQVLD